MEQEVGEVDDAVKALGACALLLHRLLTIKLVILQNGQQGAPLATGSCTALSAASAVFGDPSRSSRWAKSRGTN